MTLQLDADYQSLAIKLRKECEARKIPFNVTDLNARNWGDLMFAGKDGIHSYEIKGAAEILGGIDHLESQLLKQLPNCDHMGVLVYGKVEPAEDGNCVIVTHDDYTGTKTIQGKKIMFWNGYAKLWENHPDSGVIELQKRRYFRQNYLGYKSKVVRFYSDHGIECYPDNPDLDALVTQIIALYTVGTTEGHTFSRLIPEKYRISETDKARRDFMLTLMGIQGAGIGEEVADAIANFAGSLWWLVREMESEEACREMAAFPLRSGKRRVGEAAVKKLKAALGLGHEE